MLLYMFTSIYDWRIDHDWKRFNWSKGAKWSFYQNSTKLKVDQVDFWSTINSMSLFSHFMVNGGIRSRESVELEITFQRSYLKFWIFPSVHSVELWLIITFSIFIKNIQSLYVWEEEEMFFNFTLDTEIMTNTCYANLGGYFSPWFNLYFEKW